MLKKSLTALRIGFHLIIFLGFLYYFFMYNYTEYQILSIQAQVRQFESAEMGLKTVERVKDAVGGLEYAFYYYPGGHANMFEGTEAEHLLETLRRNSVRRMVTTLNERFPESAKGDSPAAWIEAYGDKHKLDGWRKTEWYKKWYACLEVLSVPENLETPVEKKTNSDQHFEKSGKAATPLNTNS